MARYRQDGLTILDAQDSTGWGTAIDVRSYRHIVLLFSTDNSANITVKFAGSAARSQPTFSSAASTSNHWDYVGVYDYEDGAFIDGDTGIALTGTDDLRTLLINTDGINFINAQVSARSAGDATVKVALYNDND